MRKGMAMLLLLLPACGGGDADPVDAGQSGLDSRPANSSCLAGASPQATLGLQQVFGGVGFGPLEDQVRRNMEMFEKTFAMFAPFARGQGTKAEEKPQGSTGEMDDLKRQLDDLQKRIDKLGSKE